MRIRSSFTGLIVASLAGALAVAACSAFGSDGASYPVADAATSPESGDGAGVDAGVHPVPDCDGGSACERVVFVTSARYTVASFGGLARADARCKELANGDAAHPRVRGRRFLAWLSDNGVSTWPTSRFFKGSGVYVRPDNQPIADDWPAFASASHRNAIDHDESGQPVSGATSVWTGTSESGTADTGTCDDWTSTIGVGVVGSAADTSASWSHAAVLECALSARFYCVEQ